MAKKSSGMLGTFIFTIAGVAALAAVVITHPKKG